MRGSNISEMSLIMLRLGVLVTLFGSEMRIFWARLCVLVS
jgi:hypothetical protein